MFKRLRNNLILLNLAILTTLLLAIFGSLYITTYQDVHNRIDLELERLLVPPGQQGGPTDPIDQPVIPIQSISFVLEITDDEITETVSRVEFTEDFYESAYQMIDDTEGSFELDTQTWDYASTNEIEGVTVIAFINTTNDYTLLSTSLTSYIIIFIISFILVALISYFLTNKSILPVKETFEKQKRFISDASHELKTPLTVINANVDVLLSQNTNKNDKKWLEYIQKEVLRMNKLTHNLLYLANVSDNSSVYQKTNVNLSTETVSLLLSTEALAYEKNIKLDYSVDPDITKQINQEQYTQAVMIILDNAIKYTPKNGEISVRLTQKGNITSLKVKNSGSGIKEENISKLFDRFYKVDEARTNTENSYGLGLSILKAICDLYHIKIDVTSVVNEYTQFELKIPA